MAIPERLAQMLGGPGRFRFVLQPIFAILLGIRDGRADAKAGRPAFLISIIFAGGDRLEALKGGARAFSKPFIVSVILDIGVQLLLFQNVRIWSALVVGTLLVALPYSLARGVTNRLIQRLDRSRGP